MRIVFLLSLASCASAPRAVPPAPNYQRISVEPAPPQADLYASCLADAIAQHRYARAVDADTTVLVFTCTGAPASAFFDGLAERSARDGTEFTRDGETYRPTSRVNHDLFGVDYCSRRECTITLNAGDFLR